MRTTMVKHIKKYAIETLANIWMRMRGLHPAQMVGRIYDLRKKQLVNLPDFSIFVMPHEYIGAMILKSKTYEPHVTAVIKKVLREGEVFLDLGANLGYFSLHASRIVKNAGKVIAFEPNPQNQQLILSSILKNEITNIRLYPYAVSDSETVLRFITIGANGTVVAEQSMDQNYHLLVQAVILDDILRDEPRIDIVKIDIEGHELFALGGMKTLISKHKPVIITEFYPQALEMSKRGAPVEYLKQILRFGYDLSIIKPSGDLLSVADENQIMNYWRSLNEESIHLDLIAQPML